MTAPGRVLILTGPPGSGKSTLAELIATKSRRAVHLDVDSFFHLIRSGYVEPWQPESHDQNAVVFRVVGDAAETYAKAGYMTIVEGVILPGWFFEPLHERLQDAELEVTTVVLRPPLEICLARASQRSARPLSDLAVVQRLWEEFADVGPLAPEVLENVDDADATSEAVMARIIPGDA